MGGEQRKRPAVAHSWRGTHLSQPDISSTWEFPKIRGIKYGPRISGSLIEGSKNETPHIFEAPTFCFGMVPLATATASGPSTELQDHP